MGSEKERTGECGRSFGRKESQKTLLHVSYNLIGEMFQISSAYS